MKDFFNIPAMDTSGGQQLKVLGFFTLLLVVFYGSSLQNGYSLDDEYAYTSNRLATNGLSDISSIFSSQSFDYGSFKFGYRPISVLSFALENQFFGVNPKVSHLVNLLLYLIISFLVLRVLLRLFPKEKAGLAICTAFFFLILPIHTEIVNNIKCRDELLMLVFGLTSLLLWMRGKDKKVFYVLSIITLFVAILSKKSALVFLGIIPVMEFFHSNGNWKRSALVTGLMFLPFVLFRLTTRFVRTSSSNRDYSFVENPLYGGELEVNKAVLVLESAWFYFKNLMFPTQFVSYYGYKTIEFQNFGLGAVMGLLVIIGLVVLAAINLKRRRIFVFGAIVLLGGVLPYLNLLMPMVGIVAERFVSVASIGFSILVVYGIHDGIEKFGKPKYNKFAVIALGIYAIAYLPVIQARNSEWESQISVMQADVEKVPESVVLNNSLGNNYFYQFLAAKNIKEKREFGAKALKYSSTSAQVYPTEAAYTNQGAAEYKVYNDSKKAELSFKKALEINPNYEDALNKLSTMLMELNRTKESINFYEILINNYPRKYIYYEGYVRQLCQVGEFEEALAVVNNAIQMEPNVPIIALLKANIYGEMKEYDQALIWSKKANVLDPGNRQIIGKINFLNNQIKNAE
jgi:Tfp pilus assembly protein PilF